MTILERELTKQLILRTLHPEIILKTLNLSCDCDADLEDDQWIGITCENHQAIEDIADELGKTYNFELMKWEG